MTANIECAVILAAGLGTRLKWLTHRRPKALMQIAGEASVIRIMRRLVAAGIRDIAINTHHHAAMLRETIGDGRRFGARVVYSHEPALLDSGGGVRQAMELLPASEALLVHNADIQADIDVQQLAGCLPRQGAVLALVDNPLHHASGDFCLHGGQVTCCQGRRLTFAGVSLWSAAVLHRWPAGECFSLLACIRDCMERQQCRGYHHDGHWFDIGRPADLYAADRYYRSR